MGAGRRRTLGLLVLLPLAGSLAAGCGNEETTTQPASEPKAADSAVAEPTSQQQQASEENWNGETAEVEMRGGTFHPAAITVTAGTKVEWTNGEADVHNVVIRSEQVSTKPMQKGTAFSYVFDEPGTYEYVCSYHSPDMAGTVTVE